MPFEVLLGLAMALVLNESFRGRGWLRAIVLIPWAMPTVVSSQMWRFIFNDRYGLFNYLLFGDATQLYWAPLAEPGLALLSIMVADIWKTSAFAALILLAGLQGIPGDLYEAASVDGASAWQKFRHVTLPLIKPALLLALLFRTIDSLEVFDLVFVMTQGGPADTTNLLQFYGYKKSFAEGMIGYGSAIAVVVFLLSLVLVNSLFSSARNQFARKAAAYMNRFAFAASVSAIGTADLAAICSGSCSRLFKSPSESTPFHRSCCRSFHWDFIYRAAITATACSDYIGNSVIVAGRQRLVTIAIARWPLTRIARLSCTWTQCLPALAARAFHVSPDRHCRSGLEAVEFCIGSIAIKVWPRRISRFRCRSQSGS